MSPRKNYNQMYKEENDVRDEKELAAPVLEEPAEKKILDDVKEEDVMEKVEKVKKAKKKEGVVVGGTLNIRKNPNGDIIGSYLSGEVIQILEDNGEWLKTDKGYVMKKFIEVK